MTYEEYKDNLRKVTLGDIEQLKIVLLDITAISEWKVVVKSFAETHNITHLDAISLAKSEVCDGLLSS